MKLAKYLLPTGKQGVGRIEGETLLPLHTADGPYPTLAHILDAEDPYETAEFMTHTHEPTPLANVELLAPIDHQEVWAAGVTYKRSRTARMEESETAASCYDRVYASPRPELFFKATPHRVSGPNQPLRIRVDSNWNVPEPELALVLNSRMELVGYTIGNDMSSRSIEGENPLYLPQAKTYDACASVGPCIYITNQPLPDTTTIYLNITRKGATVFEGSVGINQMKRKPEELVSFVYRECSFPHGSLIMTGTGIVPGHDFTLQPGDEVRISIDHIGTLVNTVGKAG